MVEGPSHSVLALFQHPVAVSQEHVGGFRSVLEGQSTQGVHHLLGSHFVGNQPVQEVQGSLLIGLGNLGVHSPAVLGAGAQAGLFFAFHAAVDGDHGQIIAVHTSFQQTCVFPGTVLVEHSLALGELSLGLVSGGGGQGLGIGGGVGDVQVPDAAEVVHVSAGDGSRLLNHAVIPELVSQRHVGQVAGETPGRGAVQTGSGECVKAQLCAASMDVVGNSLQGLKVGDLLQGVTSLLQQSGVDDEAEGLVAVAHSLQFAGFVVQVEVVGAQLTGQSGVGQIQGVFVPVLQAGHVADVENGGSLRLGHFGGQGVGVGTGSGGDNLDRHAGLLGVQSSQLLQSSVSFGLEVQVIHTAFAGGSIGSSLGFTCGASSGRRLGLGGGTAAGSQTQNHDQSQQHSNQLFHCFSS